MRKAMTIERGFTFFDEDQLLDLIRGVTIFTGMENQELLSLYRRCRIITKSSGDIVIEEGTDATDIYIILQGSAKIILNLNDEPLELLELGPGHCIGEASVVGIQKHSASAIVTLDAVLLVLSRTVLLDLYKENVGLFALLILNIARELARRLYRTDQTLLCMGKNRIKK